jgi:serine/threonine-protein kinase
MNKAVSDPPTSAGTQDPADPLGLFGQRVGKRFVPVRYLGRTSVSCIYRAVHMLMEQSCFLKIIESDPVSEDGMPESLRREAQATAKQDHSSLLRMYDAGVKDGFAYLAQEWSDGPNLRAVMNQGPDVAVPDLLNIGLQLIDAVCALHRKGVILRAFDPERILVPPVNGRVNLRLFDLSRVIYVGEKGAEDSTRKSTSGFHVRSTRYMAPEEIREQPCDERSDIYSYGVLLAELIGGEYPYATKGTGPTAYVVSHLKEEPRPLEVEGRPGVPEDLPTILLRMLAKNPADRFQSAEEVRRALEDIIVPDMMRLNAGPTAHVLDAWRNRVRSSIAKSRGFDGGDRPLGLTTDDGE